MPMFDMCCGNAACEQYNKKGTYLVKNLNKMPICRECGEKLEKIISPFFAKTSDKTGSKSKNAPALFRPIMGITIPIAKKVTRKYKPSLN